MGGVLNMMREYTKQRELVRAGKTRFCTSYLTIKSIHKQKHNLRAMFTSEEWVRSRWAKEANAKRVVETILMQFTFLKLWASCSGSLPC